jgi:O-acetylserine/cysteine efflux transporter
MQWRHTGLAVLVAAAWGLNFVVIDLALGHFPPLLLAALRFALVAVPGVFLVRRPAAGWRIIASVGLFLGVGYFGLLFLGMHLGMPAGMSSVVLQSQAAFTILFAALFLKEALRWTRIVGTVTASAGVGVIGLTSVAGGPPLFALGLVVVSAACWAASNVCIRGARLSSSIDMLIWSSLVPPLPLAVLSLFVEGPVAIATSFTGIDAAGVSALAYLVVVATLFGFGAWNSLLGRYDASAVAPYSLLVPVFGLLSAFLILDEWPGPAELAGAGIIVVGLVFVVWPARGARRAGRFPAELMEAR